MKMVVSLSMWPCDDLVTSPRCNPITLTKDRFDWHHPPRGHECMRSGHRKWMDASLATCMCNVYVFLNTFSATLWTEKYTDTYSAATLLSTQCLPPCHPPHKGVTGGSLMHQVSFSPTGFT